MLKTRTNTVFALCILGVAFLSPNLSFGEVTDSSQIDTNGDLKELGDIWPQTLKTGDHLTFDIDLLNKSNREINILHIATSCTCTTASSKVTIIPVGKSLSIPVLVNILGREGQLRGAIIIEFGDHSMRTVNFEANINVPLKAFPQVITVDCKKGNSKTFTLVVYEALSHKPVAKDLSSFLMASSVKGLNIDFKIASANISNLPSSVNNYYYIKYSLEGVLTAPSSGSFTGSLHLTDAPENLHLDVPLEINSTEDTYLVKDNILLGNIQVGEAKPCQIEVVSSVPDQIDKIFLDKMPVKFQQHELVGTPESVAAQFSAKWNTQRGLSVVHGEAVMKSGRRLPFSLVAIAN